MKNVAMIVNSLEVGGLEKVVLSLLNHLEQEAFCPHLICLDGEGALFGDPHLPPERGLVIKKQVRQFGPVAIDFRAIAEIRRFVKERNIELLHAHNRAPLIYAGIAARLAPRRPALVYSEHNQIYSASASDKKTLRYYLRLADHIVAVSGDLLETLRRDAPVPRPISVIHNGIDGERFAAADGSELRRELGIAADEFVIGTGVVISEQKGIPYLLEAAKTVLEKESRARFVIAGDGPLREALERQAAGLGFGERLLFLGHRSDMPRVISMFDLYVLPSLWEGLPLALLEALAMGKPVVCTRVGGNPEVIVDGENGWVVPPKDSNALSQAMLRVLRDPVFVATAGKVNRARFTSKFSVHAMGSTHEQLYSSVVLSSHSLGASRGTRSLASTR